ncbi:MarR family winged helix-turn-helix transcriptional regulator [Levilactobacillus bambusae]|uniref:MarR family transcriptional regulator n=1 Tax=Levilactobacillus bambusae TaxID=2024736 RepID=A0A2V1N4J8_9LACO|nr:MarR family winged helix-turn-helix transcriptional regulator [Levilactobacillus bambusae]PWG00856.1 MarR family transcriptional regulator [Levilactobacillus bambusae]
MKSNLLALLDVSKAHQHLLQQLTKKNHITVSEWILLGHINEGITTQEKLSEVTSLDTSTLSRQLKGLLKKEFVTKTAVGRDKRQLIYSMTARGAEALTQVNGQFETLSDSVFDHWPEDERNLLQILLNRLDKSLTRVSSDQ